MRGFPSFFIHWRILIFPPTNVFPSNAPTATRVAADFELGHRVPHGVPHDSFVYRVISHFLQIFRG